MNLRRFVPGLATLVIGGLIIWFYHWTAGAPKPSAAAAGDYYNLLVAGFRDGQLAMKVTPDPWLGVDSSRVQGYLLDASFYQGRYYLYFGVTPALLVFWPWQLLAGQTLPESLAVVLLAALAFGLSVGWLGTLRRHFFPGSGTVAWLLAVVLLGLGTGYAVVIRRPLFYEVAIFSGVACTMGGFWCLTLAVLRRGQAGRWLGAASLCAGLAAGSRPTLVPGALLALGLTAGYVWWRDRSPVGSGRFLGRVLLTASGPVGLMLAGLAWYNWARFGNPLEFGLHYQVGSNADGFPFTFAALRRNLELYYFNPPDFSWFFPFFAPGAKPPGSYQEQVHGQFFWLLIFLPSLGAAGWTVWQRHWNRDLAVVVAAVIGAAGASLVFVCLAPPHSNRYQLDFHPALVSLAVLALLAWSQAAPFWSRLGWLATGWSGVIVVFNVCASLHVHGFFQATYPGQFARLARITDRLVWPVHQFAAPRLGGLEVLVRFPAGTPGAIEPLLVAGGGTDMDGLLIRYTAPGRGRIVFEHLNYGGGESDDFDLRPGRARWMKIHLGTLYPPTWHPWYENLPSGMERARQRVSVKLDGVEVFGRDMLCYQASANQVVLGRRAGFPIGAERFSGTIERVRGLKADTAWRESLQAGTGVLRLKLLLPRDRFGAHEPLLVTGTRGRSDVLNVNYVRDGVVRFAVEHEGLPAVSSPDFAWDYAQPLDLVIRLGSLPMTGAVRPDRTRGIQVEAAGQVVLEHDFTPYPATTTQVYVGCLPWPLGPNRLLFGGKILEQADEREDAAPLRRARWMLLAGYKVALRFTLPRQSDGGNQPLVTTGITGRGDGLYLEYATPGTVRIGFDHWGSQPLISRPVPVQPGQVHQLSVSFGTRISSRETVRGQLQVQLDDRPVLDEAVDLFPAEDDQVFFGGNPIGLSTSQPAFNGLIELLNSVPPAAR